MVHFHQHVPSYHFGLPPLSPKEVKMKKDLYVWYQGTGYEEGFGLGKVLSFQKNKM